MDDQFSIGLSDLNFAPNGKWTSNISNLIVPIKFGPPEKKID
jgi:hypothetical protein